MPIPVKKNPDLRPVSDAIVMSSSVAWAKETRLKAVARAESQGFPSRQDEYWKYTQPDAFISEQVKLTSQLIPELEIFPGQTEYLINFENGHLSSGRLPSVVGCDVERLGDSATLDNHWVRDLYGQLELAGQNPVERSLAAVNTALATEGVILRATGLLDHPIRIHSVSNGNTDAIVHHVIKVEPGASMTLIETGQYGTRTNIVIEVDVADTGCFHHIRVQDGVERHIHSHIFARLGKMSTFKSFTLTSDVKLTRNECVLELTGDNANATVAGACLGDGEFHHDDTIFVTHDAVNCESRQVFKKVLRNGAVGVFQGKILVKSGAQKTDGYQISQSLLLDDDSQFLAKPELEIYADDVVCSHGSTSGAIDDDALFYLRSRGVSHTKAVDLLTLSFVAEAIQEIEDDTLADAILNHLTKALEIR